jgi:hypothetical protein
MRSGNGARAGPPPSEAFGADARVLERKSGRPAVIAYSRDGRPEIIKFWWPRRTLWGRVSTAPARRQRAFLAASRLLAEAGVPGPEPAGWGRYGRARWVSYAYRPGRTLRQAMADGTPPPPEALATFLLGLHDSGVYFRALNLGNVLETGPGEMLALIDVGGLRRYPHPLSMRRRARNLAAFLTHARDIDRLLGEYGRALMAAYASGLTGDRRAFMARLRRRIRAMIRIRRRRRQRRDAPPLAIERLPEGW